MKKLMVIMTFLILLIGISNASLAASNQIINVTMNGASVKVTQVPIIMDGQALVSDIPSFIHIDRTLVPVRFVTEKLGAKVDWDQKTKSATVLLNNKEIKLTIDSPKVTINNETVTLDKNSIPKLVVFANQDSRTMVPLAFISQMLGYKVGWDNVNRVPYINTNEDEVVVELNPEVGNGGNSTEIGNLVAIKNIQISKGSTGNQKVVITSDDKISYKTMFLPDNNKLVIDIENSKLNMPSTGDEFRKIDVIDDNFSTLEYSQYSINPYVTRVVIKMNDKLDYDIVPSNDGKTTVISFVNKIKGFTVENINGKDAIVVHSTKNAKFSVMKLKSPERVVIDILDSSLADGEYFSYNFTPGYVKGVRVSQFNVDNNYSPIDRVVRVVLDVKDGVTDPNIKIDTFDDKLVIYPEKNFWENISYEIIEQERLVTINNLFSTYYSLNYDSSSKTMEVFIPSDSVDLNEGVVIIKDGLIDEIEVIKDNGVTTVLIKFRKAIEYQLLSSERDEKISLALKPDANAVTSDRLIIIDAGHGGTDPGAVSQSGNREKDINLSISKKLNESLLSLGYNTLMTRSSDVFIDLYERARIANASNGDIFVSIHANAHDNKTIGGIQVLYCPATQSEKKDIDQHPFAKTIMTELLKVTGAEDRGIIQRPKLVVLRETNMPAVLVEVGFLSNPAEEKLITNEAYQYKIIEGIIKGIENYFKVY